MVVRWLSGGCRVVVGWYEEVECESGGVGVCFMLVVCYVM